MPSWRDHFQRFARYNVWATERLLAQHVEPLGDDEYRSDAGLYFKSIHGTLNHLLVAEHELWFVRFSDGVSPKRALNEEIESDRSRLAQRLRAASRRWEPLIAAWNEARFDGNLDYTTTKGVAQSLPFAATLAHVFNHATHHRGQISAAITAMGHRCPELDLVWMLQEESRPT
jgi:uncharacterized damage-inducible protein DinB